MTSTSPAPDSNPSQPPLVPLSATVSIDRAEFLLEPDVQVYYEKAKFAFEAAGISHQVHSSAAPVLFMRGLDRVVRKAYLAALAYHVGCRDLAAMEPLQKLFEKIQYVGVSSQALTNYINAFDSQQLRSPEHSRFMIGEAFAQACVRNTMLRPNWQSVYIFRMATGGLPMGVWQSQEITGQGQEILDNTATLYEIYDGFKADTFAARRLPSGQPEQSDYEKFARDIASRLGIVFHRDRDGFPGPGIMFTGIDFTKALSAYYDSSHIDPLHIYRRIWPAATEIDDLPTTRFLISRGLIAVIPPHEEKYFIALPGMKAEHYSLVVYNSHHRNFDNKVAILVPSEILEQQLSGSIVDVAPHSSIPDNLQEINASELRAHQLAELAAKQGKFVIHVGDASVLSGHYEYALPADAPLHFPFIASSDDKTIYGHRKPELPVDRYLHSAIRPDLQNSIFHKMVAAVVKANLNLIEMQRIIRGNWSKGNTAAQAFAVNFPQEELTTALQENGLSNFWTPNCVRMLAQAYSWNALRAKNSKMRDKDNALLFPVLAVGKVRGYSAPPVGKFYIDTFSGDKNNADAMTFSSVNGARSSISSKTRGLGLDDAIFFVREVLQHYPQDEFELRFYDRRSLPVLEN